MGDRPIIFSGPMVRALLDGRKSQTRRLLPAAHPRFPQHKQIRMDVLTFDPQRPEAWYWDGVHDRVGSSYPIPYAPGDRLYVREAIHRGTREGLPVCYRADWNEGMEGPWRPSIHMPRWASRITLTVTEVRVQRLQEISEADCFAEGVEPFGPGTAFVKLADAQTYSTPRGCYNALWNSLHGPDAWDENPWVMAVSFTVQHGNIDQVPHA